ncbi:hypothetical protein HN512_03320 [Candidatus Peregrinibacteria bacterium]|jgi:hypothetical protein|nr:hypothetical protein [Candidatus Peregrinibacteria bacterium]MBT3598843.1 hypothetical protein [Candidatus Peregrinibacteria bacterium]MBT4367712.1 hypothetical protein [Candidatus Peregrinibacteria bacterium]MBT4586162.1 hypothetical protein [Candidatus Peregrinibacteria bacterium]MBT6730819.1 hypothetical protein [Candidatus Peregrinibacteria bacterium]
MKKVSLLISTLGGAMAGYLFSNKKLREELSNSKDPEAAAKSLAKHLQKDGKKLACEMQKFIESEDFQQNVGKAKKYAKDKGDQARKELHKAAKTGGKKATTAAKTAAKSAAGTAKKKAKKTAKKVKKRVQTKTRKLS